MPITESDIVIRLSVVAAAGDTTASTPDASLGDQVSTTALVDASLHNLFDRVDGDEAEAGDVEYRCVFVLNNHASLTLTSAQVEVLSETAGGATVDVATDDIAPSAKDSASAQAAVIANESTAPVGVSAFGDGPLSLGDIAPGQVKGIWIRRTVPVGASSVAVDGCVLYISGDTLP